MNVSAISVATRPTMASSLGGAVSPVLTPLIAKQFGWTAALDVAAVVILSMGSLWFLVHPERSVDPE